MVQRGEGPVGGVVRCRMRMWVWGEGRGVYLYGGGSMEVFW